jgi:hypothetical protein
MACYQIVWAQPYLFLNDPALSSADNRATMIAFGPIPVIAYSWKNTASLILNTLRQS